MFLLCALADASDEGAIARVGETLGGAVVTVVEVHPEFERYTLEKGGLGLFEVTTGSGGLCDHAGLTLFPRPELLEQPANAPGVDAAAPALCERLAASPPALRARHGSGAPVAEGTSGSPGRVEVDGPYQWGVLHVALGALVVSLAALLWRARSSGGWAAVAMFTGLGALVRLVYSPVGIGNGNLAGYEKLVFARGTLVDTPYGAGWGTIMGLVPGWPDGVFWANFVFASISVGLVVAIAAELDEGRSPVPDEGRSPVPDEGRSPVPSPPFSPWGRRWREAPDEGRSPLPLASLAAGIFFAFLPVHVGVSRTETMHVTALVLVLTAVFAALRFGRDRAPEAALAAALAVGLAVNVRPDAALAVLPVFAAVWVGKSRRIGSEVSRLSLAIAAVALTTLGALVFHAVHGSAAAGALSPPDLGALVPRFGAPGPERSFQLFFHAGFTPPVLWGLALLGLAALRRRPFTAAFLIFWALVTTLPLAGKVLPLVDAVRLQLGGQAAWVVLAGIGVAALPRWATVAALLSFTLYFPLKPWVQTEEWTFLRRVVPTLSATTTVAYPPGHQREGAFAAVMEHLGPARWTGGAPPPGGLHYVGLECRLRSECPDAGTPVETTELRGRVDVDVSLADPTIGFWSVPHAARTRLPGP